MRYLALLLLLANVGVFLWANYLRTPETVLSTELATPQPPPTLRLARERSAAENAQLTAELSCLSVGPLASDEHSAQLAQRLSTAGFSSTPRSAVAEALTGYWVSLQGLATPAAAEQALKTLQAAGISDAYVLAEEQPPVLSLGVFSEPARAERRSAEIARLGFTPVIQDRTRPTATRWLDIALQEPGQKIDPALLQTDSAGIMRLQTRPCPAAVAAITP